LNYLKISLGLAPYVGAFSILGKKNKAPGYIKLFYYIKLVKLKALIKIIVQ